MTAKIHHATKTRAAKSGIVLTVDGDEIVATHENGTKLATGPKAADVLNAAIDAMAAGFHDNRRSAVKKKYKAMYAHNHATCGDRMAFAYQEQLYSTEDKAERREIAFRVADENGLDDARNRYAGLNTGMVRMNIANRLRGMLRKGIAVHIAGERFEPEAAPVVVTEAEGETQAA